MIPMIAAAGTRSARTGARSAAGRGTEPPLVSSAGRSGVSCRAGAQVAAGPPRRLKLAGSAATAAGFGCGRCAVGGNRPETNRPSTRTLPAGLLVPDRGPVGAGRGFGDAIYAGASDGKAWEINSTTWRRRANPRSVSASEPASRVWPSGTDQLDMIGRRDMQWNQMSLERNVINFGAVNYPSCIYCSSLV